MVCGSHVPYGPERGPSHCAPRGLHGVARWVVRTSGGEGGKLVSPGLAAWGQGSGLGLQPPHGSGRSGNASPCLSFSSWDVSSHAPWGLLKSTPEEAEVLGDANGT